MLADIFWTPLMFQDVSAQLSLLFALAEQIKFYVLVFQAILNWEFEINIKCMMKL